MSFLPRRGAFAAAFLALGLSLPAYAQPAPPPIAARSWLVYDRAAGRVLASSEPDLRWEPASLTKLMTAYIVYEAVRAGKLSLQQVVEAPDDVRRIANDESRMYLRPGNRVSVETLLHGLLIISANDAAVTLATAVDGSEAAFVAHMNATAKQLGMTGTHFENPSGIPGPTHFTTSSDLLKLALAFDRDFPQVYDITRQRRFTFRDFAGESSNLLMRQDGAIDGLKTGHTKAAGYNMIVSRRGNDRGLISIVLGTGSKTMRDRSSRELLDYAANAFEVKQAMTAGQELKRVRVYGATADDLSLGVEENRFVALPRGENIELRVTLNDENNFAPIPRGTVMGQVEAMNGDTVVATAPLIALEEADPSAWPFRLYDRIALLLSRYFG
ncbi:D-alanyl-D-alanine carboxypeptidase [Acetobacteraceae bacterium H6797]|nr:D-alanyl-D-alanine carboxypeptidase [Acetobacteraceae bacterium H6797]